MTGETKKPSTTPKEKKGTELGDEALDKVSGGRIWGPVIGPPPPPPPPGK